MEFKNTNCRACGTNQSPLFVRPNARDNKDYFCKPCMTAGKHLEVL